MIEKGPFIYRVFLLTFWINVCYGFIAEEIVTALVSLKPYVMLFCDVLVLLAGVFALKTRFFKWSVFSFLAIAFISTVIVNKYSVVTFINGSRGFWWLLFTVPSLYYFFLYENTYGYIKKFEKHLLVFLYIQCFCTVWQFAKYGAGDAVGGSMGWGSSGNLSLMVYMLSFYFMSKKFDRAHYFESLRKNWLYLFLLYPTFLNETKASFIYLILYFLLLNKFEVKTLLKICLFLPLIFGVMSGLLYVYAMITEQDFNELTGIDFYEEYLIGEDPDAIVESCQMYYEGAFDKEYINQWETDLPRFTKIVLLSSVLDESKGGLILGEGVGQYRGGTVLQSTPFTMKNEWFLNGTRIWTITLILQVGIIGFLWFVYYFIALMNYKNNNSHFAVNLKVYLTAITIFLLVYGDSFSRLEFCVIFFYILFSSQNFDKKRAELVIE